MRTPVLFLLLATFLVLVSLGCKVRAADSYTGFVGDTSIQDIRPLDNDSLGNCSSVGVLQAVIVTPPAEGQLVQTAQNVFEYIPNDPNVISADYAAYEIWEISGGTKVGVCDSSDDNPYISFTILGDPAAQDDRYSVRTGETLTVTQGVLTNDETGDPFVRGDSYLLAGPANGSLTDGLGSGGGFEYTPNDGFLGTDSFTYTLEGATSTVDSATASIDVRTSKVTLGNDDVFAVVNSNTLSKSAPGVLFNDPEASTISATVAVIDEPDHGSVTLGSDGSFTYTVTGGYTGQDSFTYRISSSFTASSATTSSDARDVAVVTLNIVAPLTAGNDRYSAVSGVATTVSAASGVLYNDGDPNGATLTADKLSDPTKGILSLAADGGFTYTPTAGQFGVDTFTYRADNGSTTSAPATVTFDVSMNPAPIAWPDVYPSNLYSMTSTTLDVAAPGVLGNDANALQETSLLAVIVSNPSSGTVSLDSDGSFSYTPIPGFSGTDTFTYKAQRNGTGDLESGTTTVSIEAVSLTALGVTSFTPVSGITGTEVTITGTQFTGATAVAFDGANAAFTVVDDNTITATAPASVTTGSLAVTTPSGTASSGAVFGVAPKITGFSPTTGLPGSTVTITGTGFTGAVDVSFAAKSATNTVSSDTTITATVPTDATTGTISVVGRRGTAIFNSNFTVLVATPPAVPAVGTIGMWILGLILLGAAVAFRFSRRRAAA
jgi:hypothetical protein